MCDVGSTTGLVARVVHVTMYVVQVVHVYVYIIWVRIHIYFISRGELLGDLLNSANISMLFTTTPISTTTIVN